MDNIIAGDLVRSSMRLAGILATGETPSADEMQDGLATLNDMLEELSLESTWPAPVAVFNLAPGQSAYSVGIVPPPGTPADVPVARWVRVLKVQVLSANQRIDAPMYSQQDFASVSSNPTASPLPTAVTYLADAPLGVLRFWPTPTEVAQVTVTTDRVLDAKMAQTTRLTGPPGYTKVLRYLLAVELAPEYGMEPSATVAAVAAKTKANFKRAHLPMTLAKMDVATLSGGASNWRYV